MELTMYDREAVFTFDSEGLLYCRVKLLTSSLLKKSGEKCSFIEECCRQHGTIICNVCFIENHHNTEVRQDSNFEKPRFT